MNWVSREMYENMAASALAYRNLLADADRRYDALLEKYHALKLQGAAAPPAVAPVQVIPLRAEEPYDDLKALIAERAGTDLRKRFIMLRQLKQDRADGISPEEIRRAIENGVQSDGVPA